MHDKIIERLRTAGARFAYLHGSRAEGTAGEASDVDVAAFFGRQTDSWDVTLPDGVDLLVLDAAPLELAGRVATKGKLLFDDDPPQRVRWEALTRTIYFDELPRIEQARADFVAGRRRG